MKNLKRFFAIVISLTMVLSLFGAFPAQAESTEYNFYTQVGANFTPETDGVTWNNIDTIDTSVMGRQVIYGTKDGANVKGIVNVGTQKWNSYQNNEGMTLNSEVSQGSKILDQWRYAASSDTGSELATYVQDPDNSNNIVVKYNGGANITASVAQGKKVNYNQIQLYPATQTGLGNSFSVEFRFRADGDTVNGDTYDLQFRNSVYNCYDSLTFKRVASGLAVSLVPKGGKTSNGTAVTWDDNPKVDEWLDIKYMVYEQEGTIYSCIYLNGERILNVASMNKTTVSGATKIVPIEYFYIKNSAGIALTDINNAKRFAAYIDDVKVTDLTTSEYIYYDSFDSESNYEYMQAEGTQEMAVNETVKFVTATGADSGYSTEIYASAVADTSKLGTFKSTTTLPGFDEPIAIRWTVFKNVLAWEETFENYTETDIGKAPNRLPWLAGTTGKTIAYENPDAEEKNTVLKYTIAEKDGDWLKLGDGKHIEGKFSVEWSFMLPELVSGSQFTFTLLRESGHPFVEPAIAIDANGKGKFTFGHYKADGSSAGSVTLITNGELLTNKWYKVKFAVDTIENTFSYAFEGVEHNEKYGARYQNNSDAQAKPEFTQLRLAQRQVITENATIYIDNVKTNKILTVKEPVAKSITVYKGDEVTLPQTATVLLSDDVTTDEAEVTWNGSVDTSTVGEKTVTGTVTGSDSPATLNVNVSYCPYDFVSANLKNGDTEVFGLIKGGALCSATINKISVNTMPARIYAALYDASRNLVDINFTDMNTSEAWNKDEYKDIAITLDIPNGDEIDIDTYSLSLFVFSDSIEPYAEAMTLSNTYTQADTTVWIAGDSLAEAKSSSARPSYGWGEAFAALDAEGMTVVNRAIGGRSSKSFYEEGSLKDILSEATPGDYLLIMLGTNDSKTDEPRFTSPEVGGTYEQYLTKYITESRAKGVIPVILTPIVRGRYDKNDVFEGDTHAGLDKYAAAARRVAAFNHVPLIDIHSLTTEMFSDMKKEETWKYFNYYSDTTNLVVGNADTTHLNEDGAELVANMIKTEMENLRLPLYKLFK